MSDQVTTEAAAPTTSAQRIDALDTVRGIAVLGILAMNIMIMGNLFALFINPAVLGEPEPYNLAAWYWTHLLLEGTMRTIFGMLFGAGVYLFFSRIEEREGTKRARRLHLKRTSFLMLFGLIDGFLFLWVGDILFLYGLMGLFIWLFRDSSTKKLVTWIIVFFLIGLGMKALSAFGSDYNQAELARITALVEAGETLSQQDKSTLASIKGDPFAAPTPERAKSQQETIASGYAGAFETYTPITLFLMFLGPIFFMIWDSGVTMLLGLLLFKKGFFEARWSTRSYALVMVLGYAIGISLRVGHLDSYMASGFDLSVYNWGQLWYDPERLGVAFGHLGLVMLLIKGGIMPLSARLAAVGRMALTNYLTHSLLALLIFVILGRYGKYGEAQLLLIMLGIWVLQLVYSPIWLRYFRFGPAEWLWRSLTYGTSQRMRKSA